MVRHTVGPRHEGSLILAIAILVRWSRVYEFTFNGRSKEANILRDSVLVRGSCTPFLVDLHVRAIMMYVMWDELRARGNLLDKDGRAPGPLYIADLNDQLWKFGTMLRSPDDDVVLRVLDDDYVPLTPDPRMGEWRRRRAARTVPTVDGTGEVNYMTTLGDVIRAFGRDDWVSYKPLLLRFLCIFGEGIHESLTRTCSDQLTHLSGKHSTAEALAWMKQLSPDLVNDNDLAESPFSVVRSTPLFTRNCFSCDTRVR